MKYLLSCLLLIFAGCDQALEPNTQTVDAPVAIFPTDPRHECPDSRARYYAECAGQRIVFAEAVAAARAQDKLVLVEFGAEWCPWCHILHRHLTGETFSQFDYTYRDGETYRSEEPQAEADVEAARALGTFMAEQYVLVHIDSDDKFGLQPVGGTGWDLVQTHGMADNFADWVPFSYVVGPDGRVIGEFDSRRAEKSDRDRGYIGYDRAILLDEAKRLVTLAGVGDE